MNSGDSHNVDDHEVVGGGSGALRKCKAKVPSKSKDQCGRVVHQARMSPSAKSPVPGHARFRHSHAFVARRNFARVGRPKASGSTCAPLAA